MSQSTLTLRVDEKMMSQLSALAAARGERTDQTAISLLADSLRHMPPDTDTPPQSVSPESSSSAPTTPPDWILALEPVNPSGDGTNGLHRLWGTWPGDETDEEVETMLRRIDDEDAGRI